MNDGDELHLRVVVAPVSRAVDVPIDTVLVAPDLAFLVQSSAGLTFPVPFSLRQAPAVVDSPGSTHHGMYAFIITGLDVIEWGGQNATPAGPFNSDTRPSIPSWLVELIQTIQPRFQ